MTARQEFQIFWDDIEEVDADEDDVVLIEKIKSHTDGYGEYVAQEDLLKRLGITK
ncbi:MAG: hypothetical protein FWH10_06055 [Oscillospiraceae bacterium]|nr:hypothetical protein [Oscillospiraceae bacterium]